MANTLFGQVASDSLFIVPYPKKTSELKFDWKMPLGLAAIGYGGGSAMAFREMFLHHKDDARRIFPNFDTKLDPDVTWTWKYKNKDFNQGPAYFGSTNFLVWTTDWYHGLAAISTTSVLAIGYNCKLDFNLFHLKRDIREFKARPKRERKIIFWQNLTNGTAGTLGRGAGSETVLYLLPKMFN